jgi:hypothetical protein
MLQEDLAMTQRQLLFRVCTLAMTVAAVWSTSALAVDFYNPGFEIAGMGGPADSDGWTESGTLSQRDTVNPRTGAFAHQIGGINNGGLDSGSITQDTLAAGMLSLTSGDLITAEFFANVLTNTSMGGSTVYSLDIVNAAGASVASTGNLPLSNTAGYVKFDTISSPLVVPPLGSAPNHQYGARLTIEVTQFSDNFVMLGRAFIDDVKLTSFTPVRWISPTSGLWDVAANWSGAATPAAGDFVTIDPASSLAVTGPAAAATVAALHLGGTGSGPVTLELGGGNLHATQLVAVRPNGELLMENGRRVISAALVNDGVVRGDGTIEADLDNGAEGEIRVIGGERLHVIGAGPHTNDGRIEVLGLDMNQAEIEFTGPLANGAAGGVTTGHSAIMRFNSGLNNTGALALTGGANDVSGDIDNTGDIVVTGGATATFHDDVVNDGTLQVSQVGSTTSVAVFLGAFSGDGTSAGGGDIFFEGDLRPGNSPANVTLGNNVSLGPGASLQIELGGVMQGSQYDHVAVSGDLSLDGALEVSLIDAGAGVFVPNAGDSFDVLDWGTLSGAFDSVLLPALSGPLTWDTSQLYTTGVLSVTGPAFSADFDADGDVDSGDLAQWRGDFGVNGLSDADDDGDSDGEDFLAWQRQLGSGVPTMSTAVPEPDAAIQVLWATILLSAACRLIGLRRIASLP